MRRLTFQIVQFFVSIFLHRNRITRSSSKDSRGVRLIKFGIQTHFPLPFSHIFGRFSKKAQRLECTSFKCLFGKWPADRPADNHHLRQFAQENTKTSFTGDLKIIQLLNFSLFTNSINRSNWHINASLETSMETVPNSKKSLKSLVIARAFYKCMKQIIIRSPAEDRPKLYGRLIAWLFNFWSSDFQSPILVAPVPLSRLPLNRSNGQFSTFNFIWFHLDLWRPNYFRPNHPLGYSIKCWTSNVARY